MSQITKRALADSLKKLMQNKPLSKITVGDIAEDCGVSRHTFYYHFQDIYDLMEWIYQSELEERIKGKREYNTWQQGILAVLNYAKENKVLISNVYHSMDKEVLFQYLLRITFDLLTNVIEEKSQGLRVDEEHKRFIANFYKYAFVGLVIEWVGAGMKEEPEKLVQDLSLMLQGEFVDAIEKFQC